MRRRSEMNESDIVLSCINEPGVYTDGCITIRIDPKRKGHETPSQRFDTSPKVHTADNSRASEGFVIMGQSPGMIPGPLLGAS